jgi:hypothetical protein
MLWLNLNLTGAMGYTTFIKFLQNKNSKKINFMKLLKRQQLIKWVQLLVFEINRLDLSFVNLTFLIYLNFKIIFPLEKK